MTGVAIFVKTPGLLPVKSRLAKELGAERSISLFRACADAVAEAAGQATIGPVYWATAESGPETDRYWTGLPRLEQGRGGLGERMHRIMAELVKRHGSGLLLGADAPQIDPTRLGQAAGWLNTDTPRQVIGPARDGGFWTYGANHLMPLERWTRVAYSRSDTLLRFRQSMGDDAQWLELPALTDLDTAADLPKLQDELHSLHNPTVAQQQALELLSSSLKPET